MNILDRLREQAAAYRAADERLHSAEAATLTRPVRASLRRERRFHSREAQRLVSAAMSEGFLTADIHQAAAPVLDEDGRRPRRLAAA